MAAENNPLETQVATAASESAVDTDFTALLSMDDTREVGPTNPLETALATVDKSKELAATSPQDAKFRFRELLTPQQRADLEKGAPLVAQSFIKDVNQIMAFGGGTIEKMKQFSVQMLDAQKRVEIPEADRIIGDLLREMDGFSKKYRNAKFEDFGKKVMGIFKTAKYSIKTMARDMKPLEEKLDLVELKLEEMDSQLADNVTRGQILHSKILEQMKEVVSVLAALEEIIELIRKEYEEANGALQEATAMGEEFVVYKGERITTSELQSITENISTSLSEAEKSWHDWRQQFFMGWGNAPATRNLVITTIALRRRLKTFKDMGIQSGRQALVTWKQAAEARKGAELGMAVQEGANKMIQYAYKEVADTTKMIAEASQAPIISEETVHAVIDSVRSQAKSIVEADRQGRALRARNLQALERGEVQIKDEVLAMQEQLAANARQDPGIIQSRGDAKAVGKGDNTDLIQQLTQQ